MKLLDCTLRDGGYYTNWDFNRSQVELYISAFNVLPVDYLEIGYRSLIKTDYFGEFFYCPDYVIDFFRNKSNKKLAIILDEKDISIECLDSLLNPCKDKIDLIRIAIDPQHIIRALKIAEKVKAKGFEVGFNVMYMSKWKLFPDFLNDLSKINGIVDYLYMVDSYGGVYPDDIRNTIQMIQEKTETKLGFHGHNNLELALINSLTAIENGVELVDTAVTGMGRGAGNLKTELLLTVLNKKYGTELDFNALSSIVESFEQLRKKHEWGTNLPYMVSGANSLPQKDVMEWVTKRYYSINSIIQALQCKMGVSNNSKLELFSPNSSFKKVIIIGGGNNAHLHAEAISKLVEREREICLVHASSKNAKYYKDLSIKQYYCLVGNEGYRLERVFDELNTVNGECVLPPSPRVMGTYVPSSLSNLTYELPQITFTNIISDSHTVLALQTALLLGAKEVWLAGYDGYNEGLISKQEQDLTTENEQLFQDFKNNTEVYLSSITSTNYKSVTIESVYSKLI